MKSRNFQIENQVLDPGISDQFLPQFVKHFCSVLNMFIFLLSDLIFFFPGKASMVSG